MATNAQGKLCVNWPLTIASIGLFLGLLSSVFGFGITYERLNICMTREEAATTYVTKADLDKRLASIENGQSQMLRLLQGHMMQK